MVDITGGLQIRRGGGVFQSQATQLGTTGTVTVGINQSVDVVTFVGPTATVTNYRTLSPGTEGQEIMLVYGTTGTGGGTTASGGDIHIYPTGTATGPHMRNYDAITLRQVDQYCRLRYMNDRWHVMERTTWEEHVPTASGGALPLTVDATLLVRSTGTDMAITLANGFEGQRYMLTSVAGTCVRPVTPANLYGYTSIDMGQTSTQGNDGAWVELQFMQGAWHIMSGLNLTATSISFISDTIVN